MNSRVPRTLAILLLSAITGCGSGPFRHKPVPPPALTPDAPELSQTPLYAPEMSENNPGLPNLPSTPSVAVAAPPPPPPAKPHRNKKTKPASSTSTAAKTTPAAPKSSESSSGPSSGLSAASTKETPGSLPVSEKKTQPTNIADAAAVAASPIGQLTAGSSAEAAQTSQKSEDLIRSTREGLDNIKRTLTPDEKKTATDIRTFLARAEAALKNGDVDGAFGLATKGRLLLDELTEK